MAYRREDIERVRAATNLVELIAEVTKVRKSGRSVMAICPFHQEKTPSLSVDPARGLYHCFGCGQSGDVFRFLEDSQGLGFSEAVELLARKAGIVLRTDPGADRRRSRREALVKAMHEAVDFYNDRLRNASDAGAARSYLRGRGYDSDIVEQFQLGYAPSQWDELVIHLKSSAISDNDAIGAGLASRSRQGRLIDRFRGRVLFPIFDLRGDPVGFGGRLLEGEGPKYLNSAEGPLYHKSQLLYGLNWAKSEIVRSGESVVVEGYTDVIAMHQAGMPVAVATCGTALGSSHLDLLRRFSERVVLAFDADSAGAEAALRGLEQDDVELDLRIALMPKGMDPADMVSAGELDGLRKSIEESSPLVLFAIERELDGFDLTEPEARVRAARAAGTLVARHPDPLARREYVTILARRTGLDFDDLLALVEGQVRRKRPAARKQPADLSGQERAEREFLRALMDNRRGVKAIEVDKRWFTTPQNAAALEILAPAIQAAEGGRPLDLGALLGDDDSDVAAMLRELAMDPKPVEDPGELAGTLQDRAQKRRKDEVKKKLMEAEDDDSHLSEYLELEHERRRLGGQE